MTDLVITPTDVDKRLDAIRAEDDPAEKVKAADALIPDLTAAREVTLDRLNQALAALGVIHNVKAVKAYRLAGVERIVFYRAKAHYDTADKIDPALHDLDTANGVAAELGPLPQRYKDAIKQAQALRNEAILELADGDQPMSNENIAALTSITAERVSQIKTGKSN